MKKLLKSSLAILIALFAIVVITSCVEGEWITPEPVDSDLSAQAVGLRPHVPYLTHLYTEITTDTWYVLVDLSDTTNYPHIHSGAIILKSLRYAGDMASAQHWHWNVGVIVTTTATSTDIEWISGGARTKATQFNVSWPLPEHGLNLMVADGALPFVGTIVSETNVITSGTILEGTANITAPLAVGDLILYLDETGDEVTFHFTMDATYDTE